MQIKTLHSRQLSRIVTTNLFSYITTVHWHNVFQLALDANTEYSSNVKINSSSKKLQLFTRLKKQLFVLDNIASQDIFECILQNFAAKLSDGLF